ncbi:MAG TPA: DUF6569 family protein [Solirubrobacteraceae bacterium]
MDTLTTELTLGEPQVVGPLAVFPVFGPPPLLEYRAFSDAIEHGAFVKELDRGASVNHLLACNPTNRALLLYEGEQVIGAQQDRAMDGTVLVGAGARVEVPVSCVEQGRWDGRRHDEHFKPAPHADDPSLRRIKRESALRSAEQGLAGRPAQGEVWHVVGSRLRHFGVDSQSSKFGDLFEQRRGEIGALADDIEPAADQVGALACVGGAPIALDVVSRPQVFRALHERLVRGYALDALSAEPARGSVADQAAAGAFLARALTASHRQVPTPGLGRAHALVGPRIVGSMLSHEDELVALCAFPTESGHGDVVGQVARPSRRRLP